MFSGFGLSNERVVDAKKAKAEEEGAPAGEGSGIVAGDSVEESDAAMSREDMMSFFDKAIEALKSDELREQVAASVNKENRPDALLMEQQLTMLDDMGVGREKGQQALNEIPLKHRGDKELVDKMREFESICNQTYITIFTQGRPSADSLRTEGDMTEDEVMEFFNSCISLMGTPETKAKLAQRFAETQEPPNDYIIEMQRDMLACLGIEPDHGISCLNKHVTSGDADIASGAQRFAMSAQRACQEAVMGTDKFEAHMAQQHEAMQRQRRLVAECAAMTPKEQQAFMKRVATQQVSIARAMASLADDHARIAYVKQLPAAEQDDLAKLNMLMGGRSGGHGHSHSHEHGAHCNHDHGHSHAAHAGEHDVQGHSHSHQHGPGCNHDHGHQHGPDCNH
ncbi:hypothetical protein JKP88DRAFT_262137 [Tribonema minus]|uniref:Uncharacterized protein n=1 Tax=Tribonema minus TaxID=303371 RepID=A0A835ZBF2_9STRA|nr:hypothetical protein JKP88DRAFT_262137 [Tribonema minus]